MRGKKSILIIFFLISFHVILAQKATTVSTREFNQLIGTWQGTLTYLDYSTNKPYTMLTDIDITRLGKTNKYIFAKSYPRESNANSRDTVSLSKNGRMINEEKVTSKQKLTNGNLKIITEFSGVDGNENKPALIRHTYTIGENVYMNRKDVQFAGQAEWIKRNEYTYKRKLGK